jgi:pSer/pThr/pTyr-binding forkhead associated (FHA) protein
VEGEQTQVVETQDLNRTQIASPVAAEATQVAIRIECAVCHTSNPPGERWCLDCGFLLSAVPGETPAEAPPMESLPRLTAVGNGGREFALRAGPNTVGRESADVLLIDGTVSRRHATITLAEGTATVEDHGSTNGTRIAGQPLTPSEPRPVYDGDEVQFGTVRFALALPGAPPRPAQEEAATTAAAAADRPVRARLVAADGSELLLREGVNTLGRRSENELVVRGDPYVSGRHADIECGAEGCVLVDVGSTNGTFLRSQRLTPGDRHTLTAGDEVRLGQSVFLLELVTPPESGFEPWEGEAPAEPSATELNTPQARREPHPPTAQTPSEDAAASREETAETAREMESETAAEPSAPTEDER